MTNRGARNRATGNNSLQHHASPTQRHLFFLSCFVQHITRDRLHDRRPDSNRASTGKAYTTQPRMVIWLTVTANARETHQRETLDAQHAARRRKEWSGKYGANVRSPDLGPWRVNHLDAVCEVTKLKKKRQHKYYNTTPPSFPCPLMPALLPPRSLEVGNELSTTCNVKPPLPGVAVPPRPYTRVLRVGTKQGMPVPGHLSLWIFWIYPSPDLRLLLHLSTAGPTLRVKSLSLSLSDLIYQ